MPGSRGIIVASTAADVRAILGSGTKIGYAADWSEYNNHQTGDAAGALLFNLDPLWSDADIDFVGIDNYMPLADWRDGRLTVNGAMKVPYSIRALLAVMLDLPEASIEVIENDAGGGFSVRGEFYPEDFLIPFAAKFLGRPVRWIEDRREHLIASIHARRRGGMTAAA